MLFNSGCKFVINGVNQERNFNKLCKDYDLSDISRKSYTHTSFVCKISKQKKIEKELKECGFEIIEKKEFGIFSFLKNLLTSYGLVAGFICGLIACIILSGFILKIDVVGLEKINQDEVYSILSNQNVTTFCKKKDISLSSLEKTLSKNIENISLVSAIIKGNTLVISIKEKVQNDEVDNLDNFQPLVSKFDGQITNIKLVQGTLKVNVGDMVKVGQILVEPYILDSSNNKRAVKPIAEIEARVWQTFKTEHKESKIVSRRTGKEQVVENLIFMGLNLTNFHNECDFPSYELKIDTICISNNNILPIYRQKITYYEMETILIEEKFEENKEKIFEEIKQKALLYLDKCDIIKNEYFNVNKINGQYVVEYVVEIIKRID